MLVRRRKTEGTVALTGAEQLVLQNRSSWRKVFAAPASALLCDTHPLSAAPRPSARPPHPPSLRVVAAASHLSRALLSWEARTSGTETPISLTQKHHLHNGGRKAHARVSRALHS